MLKLRQTKRLLVRRCMSKDKTYPYAVAAHPYRDQWHATGRMFKQAIHWEKKAMEFNEHHHDLPRGTARVQVCRSVSDWSHGVLVEHSIQNACEDLQLLSIFETN